MLEPNAGLVRQKCERKQITPSSPFVL
jgi:hypothetical protein